MPTSAHFKDFALESLHNALADTPYTFSARKMFGEYCIYVIEGSFDVPKPIFLLCDEMLYVKQHTILAPLLASAPLGFPYKGAKQNYILDIDSPLLLKEVVLTLAPTLPLPKPKKARKKPRLKLSSKDNKSKNDTQALNKKHF